MSVGLQGDSAVLVGTSEKLSASELAVIASADKAFEQTIPTLNEFLQRMLTLNTALIGGGFAIAKLDVLPYWAGLLTLGLLLVSLSLTVRGLRPIRGDVNVRGVDGLARYRANDIRVINSKAFHAKWSSRVLVAGLAVGVIGVGAKGSIEDQRNDAAAHAKYPDTK